MLSKKNFFIIIIITIITIVIGWFSIGLLVGQTIKEDICRPPIKIGNNKIDLPEEFNPQTISHRRHMSTHLTAWFDPSDSIYHIEFNNP